MEIKKEPDPPTFPFFSLTVILHVQKQNKCCILPQVADSCDKSLMKGEDWTWWSAGREAELKPATNDTEEISYSDIWTCEEKWDAVPRMHRGRNAEWEMTNYKCCWGVKKIPRVSICVSLTDAVAQGASTYNCLITIVTGSKGTSFQKHHINNYTN